MREQRDFRESAGRQDFGPATQIANRFDALKLELEIFGPGGQYDGVTSQSFG